MKLEDIVFTNHCLDRLKELKIKSEKAKSLLFNAKRQKTNILRELYKIGKYGFDRQVSIEYYYRKESNNYPGLLFTVKKEEDKWVVITITKRRLKRN